MPPSDTPDPRLADAIRRLREQRGLTQEDVAYECGLSVSAYARVERAAVNPTWTTVARVVGALDVGFIGLARALDALTGGVDHEAADDAPEGR